MPLENTILQLLFAQRDIKSVAGIYDFVKSNAMSEPPRAALREGIAELIAVGAIEVTPDANANKSRNKDDGALKITALGQHLAKLPCDVRLGKLLIYSALLSC